MAKRLSEKEIANVRLLIVELSEDELTVLTAALTTLLHKLNDRAIGEQSGASREEAEAILQDLHTFLKQPARKPTKS